jgi:hypothetical protein
MPAGKIKRFFKCESLHCAENPTWKNADYQVDLNYKKPFLIGFRRKFKHVHVVKSRQILTKSYVGEDYMDTSDAEVHPGHMNSMKPF